MNSGFLLFLKISSESIFIFPILLAFPSYFIFPCILSQFIKISSNAPDNPQFTIIQRNNTIPISTNDYIYCNSYKLHYLCRINEQWSCPYAQNIICTKFSSFYCNCHWVIHYNYYWIIPILNALANGNVFR